MKASSSSDFFKLLRLGMLKATLVLACSAAVSAGAWAHLPLHRMPLGDGKISAKPKRGYVMACSTRFGGGGAERVGPWVSNGTWDPAAKPTVQGDVQWPEAAISVMREKLERVIRSNHLPVHATGEFPVRPETLAYSYDRNPNAIRQQSVLLRLPAEPVMLSEPECVPMGMIGFAITGAAIFNAFDAQGRDAPAYEIQDACNGHPQRTGSYHYHDYSPCLGKDSSGKSIEGNVPVGWMLDGLPILGPVDEDGKTITNADLDECHGRVGAVLVDGAVKQMYHYRFTREYPYTIGCFRASKIN